MVDGASETEPAGKRRVAGVIGQAVQRLDRQLRRKRVFWPGIGGAYDGIGPGAWKAEGAVDDTGWLPEDCPVRPLGFDGESFYFEDTRGQIFDTQGKALGVERVQILFAGYEDFLHWAWPTWAGSEKNRYVKGWDTMHARRDLYGAAKEKGAWAPTQKVRGRGAWRDEETGKLILHCGEDLWVNGELQDTGQHGEFFYVRRERTFVPWPDPVLVEDNPAVKLVEQLRSWNWVRGDVDVMLALGWIGVALMGAALDWRPSAFIVGDKGTGKSELLKLFKAVLRRLMVSSANASEAGLYQLVGHDAVPIAIDELEGEDAPLQAQAIIKMARDAASGDIKIRGGQNHVGVQFDARSTFLFSAINPPPLPPASLSRLALLQLRPLENTSSKPAPLKAADTVGPLLWRRIVDGWPEWPRLYDQYRDVLRNNGHDSRGQDTFGTFLAAAHTLLGDEGMDAAGLPFEKLEHWGIQLRADVAPETANAQANWEKCLEALLTSPLDRWNKGERRTIGQILEDLADDRGPNPLPFSMARDVLAGCEIGLMPAGVVGDGVGLAIPLSSKAINGLLADTSWAGKGMDGSWKFALGQAPENIVRARVPLKHGRVDNRVSIGGVQKRVLFVSLADLKAWQEKGSEDERT